MDKIKIRKVEVSVDELFARIEKLIKVHEFTFGKFSGINRDDLCRALGIQLIVLMEIVYDNKAKFEEKFIFESYRHPRTNKPVNKIYRLETWNHPDKNKL